MKKKYVKPTLEVAEFRFSEHIVASGSDCYWGSGATWTHGFEGCETTKTSLPASWINLNG